MLWFCFPFHVNPHRSSQLHVIAFCLVLSFSHSLSADTLTFQNNKTIQGTVLQTNGENVLVLVDYGTMRFGAASLKNIRHDQTTIRSAAASTNRLPQFKSAMVQLCRESWASKLEQIPATVIETGILHNVPYTSFRCGDDYEVNIYGDLDNPAGIEAGVYRKLVSDPRARKNCVDFITSLLPPADSDFLKLLNIIKDLQTRNGLTFEITPPTDPDAYGGWWISIYSEKALNKARASDAELQQISLSKANAATQAKQQPDSAGWTLEELDKARPSPPEHDTITITTSAGITHTNARVVSVNDGVSIMWREGASGGIAKLADLSPELQRKYHYNPNKAAAAEAAEGEKKQRESQQAAAAQALPDTSDPYPLPSATYATHSSGGSVYVRGYTKSNGTYVQPYTRSAPRR
jgi:hypothetical protein